MPTAPDLPKVELAIVEITNASRTEAKLRRVAVNAQLTKAARAYADVLAKTGVFSHEADGTTMSARVEQAGYRACTVAENLAMHRSSRGFETRQLAVAAMEGWLNSPGHRRNLMTPDVTEIGVAVVRAPDGDMKYLAVQLLARPQSQSVEFQVSNSASVPITMRFAGKSRDIAPHNAVTMSFCGEGELELSASGSRSLQVRYEATTGKAYVVSQPPSGGPLAVEVRDAIKVR